MSKNPTNNELMMTNQTFRVKENQGMLYIPLHIWAHPNLKPNDKIIYAVINLSISCTRQELLDFCKDHLNMGKEMVITSYRKLCKLNIINYHQKGIGFPLEFWIGDRR